MPEGSAFTRLDAPAERIYTQPRARARLIPTCTGTYALYDARGDLLYVGKATNLRTRIQSHLRETAPHGLLPNWTRKIARVEARVAHSEIEALLVEAELIARARPSFNRQMRGWPRYCYLVAQDDPDTPLTVRTQPESWRTCFGPYRSRRQAVGVIEAVFALIVQPGRYDNPRMRIEALLAGDDDTILDEIENALTPADDASHPPRYWLRYLETLRQAYARALLLRRAEMLLNALLVLPGTEGEITLATLTSAGLALTRLDSGAGALEAARDWHRRQLARNPQIPSGRLPKPVADLACLAARHTRIATEPVALLQPDELQQMAGSDFPGAAHAA